VQQYSGIIFNSNLTFYSLHNNMHSIWNGVDNSNQNCNDWIFYVVLSLISYMDMVYLDNFCLGFSQSWTPLLNWTFWRGNRITYPRCSMSSIGWGSRSGSGSCYAFWCTAAFTALHRHISPTASVKLLQRRSSPSMLFHLRHVGRGIDEPFNTRRPCFPSGCIKSMEWLVGGVCLF